MTGHSAYRGSGDDDEDARTVLEAAELSLALVEFEQLVQECTSIDLSAAALLADKSSPFGKARMASPTLDGPCPEAPNLGLPTPFHSRNSHIPSATRPFTQQDTDSFHTHTYDRQRSGAGRQLCFSEPEPEPHAPLQQRMSYRLLAKLSAATTANKTMFTGCDASEADPDPGPHLHHTIANSYAEKYASRKDVQGSVSSHKNGTTSLLSPRSFAQLSWQAMPRGVSSPGNGLLSWMGLELNQNEADSLLHMGKSPGKVRLFGPQELGGRGTNSKRQLIMRVTTEPSSLAPEPYLQLSPDSLALLRLDQQDTAHLEALWAWQREVQQPRNGISSQQGEGMSHLHEPYRHQQMPMQPCLTTSLAPSVYHSTLSAAGQQPNGPSSVAKDFQGRTGFGKQRPQGRVPRTDWKTLWGPIQLPVSPLQGQQKGITATQAEASYDLDLFISPRQYRAAATPALTINNQQSTAGPDIEPGNGAIMLDAHITHNTHVPYRWSGSEVMTNANWQKQKHEQQCHGNTANATWQSSSRGSEAVTGYIIAQSPGHFTAAASRPQPVKPVIRRAWLPARQRRVVAASSPPRMTVSIHPCRVTAKARTRRITTPASRTQTRVRTTAVAGPARASAPMPRGGLGRAGAGAAGTAHEVLRASADVGVVSPGDAGLVLSDELAELCAWAETLLDEPLQDALDGDTHSQLPGLHESADLYLPGLAQRAVASHNITHGCPVDIPMSAPKEPFSSIFRPDISGLDLPPAVNPTRTAKPTVPAGYRYGGLGSSVGSGTAQSGTSAVSSPRENPPASLLWTTTPLNPIYQDTPSSSSSTSPESQTPTTFPRHGLVLIPEHATSNKIAGLRPGWMASYSSGGARSHAQMHSLQGQGQGLGFTHARSHSAHSTNVPGRSLASTSSFTPHNNTTAFQGLSAVALDCGPCTTTGISQGSFTTSVQRLLSGNTSPMPSGVSSATLMVEPSGGSVSSQVLQILSQPDGQQAGAVETSLSACEHATTTTSYGKQDSPRDSGTGYSAHSSLRDMMQPSPSPSGQGTSQDYWASSCSPASITSPLLPPGAYLSDALPTTITSRAPDSSVGAEVLSRHSRHSRQSVGSRRRSRLGSAVPALDPLSTSLVAAESPKAGKADAEGNVSGHSLTLAVQAASAAARNYQLALDSLNLQHNHLTTSTPGPDNAMPATVRPVVIASGQPLLDTTHVPTYGVDVAVPAWNSQDLQSISSSTHLQHGMSSDLIMYRAASAARMPSSGDDSSSSSSFTPLPTFRIGAVQCREDEATRHHRTLNACSSRFQPAGPQAATHANLHTSTSADSVPGSSTSWPHAVDTPVVPTQHSPFRIASPPTGICLGQHKGAESVCSARHLASSATAAPQSTPARRSQSLVDTDQAEVVTQLTRTVQARMSADSIGHAAPERQGSDMQLRILTSPDVNSTSDMVATPPFTDAATALHKFTQPATVDAADTIMLVSQPVTTAVQVASAPPQAATVPAAANQVMFTNTPVSALAPFAEPATSTLLQPTRPAPPVPQSDSLPAAMPVAHPPATKVVPTDSKGSATHVQPEPADPLPAPSFSPASLPTSTTALTSTGPADEQPSSATAPQSPMLVATTSLSSAAEPKTAASDTAFSPVRPQESLTVCNPTVPITSPEELTWELIPTSPFASGNTSRSITAPASPAATTACNSHTPSPNPGRPPAKTVNSVIAEIRSIRSELPPALMSTIATALIAENATVHDVDIPYEQLHRLAGLLGHLVHLLPKDPSPGKGKVMTTQLQALQQRLLSWAMPVLQPLGLLPLASGEASAEEAADFQPPACGNGSNGQTAETQSLPQRVSIEMDGVSSASHLNQHLYRPLVPTMSREESPAQPDSGMATPRLNPGSNAQQVLSVNGEQPAPSSDAVDSPSLCGSGQASPTRTAHSGPGAALAGGAQKGAVQLFSFPSMSGPASPEQSRSPITTEVSAPRIHTNTPVAASSEKATWSAIAAASHGVALHAQPGVEGLPTHPAGSGQYISVGLGSPTGSSKFPEQPQLKTAGSSPASVGIPNQAIPAVWNQHPIGGNVGASLGARPMMSLSDMAAAMNAQTLLAQQKLSAAPQGDSQVAQPVPQGPVQVMSMNGLGQPRYAPFGTHAFVTNPNMAREQVAVSDGGTQQSGESSGKFKKSKSLKAKLVRLFSGGGSEAK